MRAVLSISLVLVLAGCLGDSFGWTPCRSDAECPACARCEPSPLFGMRMCRTDPSWAGTTCQARGSAGFREPCTSNDECADALMCLNGRCTFSDDALCAAGMKRCNGDFTETCNAEGSAWETAPHPCLAGCANGECQDHRCEAGKERACDGRILLVCDVLGIDFEYLTACDETCVQDGSDAHCSEAVCEPATQRCDGDEIFVCDRSGNAWVSDGVCANGCVQDEFPHCSR